MIVRCLLLLALFSFTGCDPFDTGFADEEKAVVYRALKFTPAITGETLRIMTWNIKFGGARIDFFFDCHGDRVLMTKQEVLDNLDGLVAKIIQVDPDVLFLQEVDLSSKRSGYVDTLQYILDHTALNYAVYASQWKADFIPSDGLGRVDSGNAIATKLPLGDGIRHALPLIGEQDGLTRYFYLKRNILSASLVLENGAVLRLATIHTSAYDKDGTKKKQIDIFKKILDDYRDAGEFFIAGGDFNTLPPGSVKKKNFEDSACKGSFEADDFSNENDYLSAFYRDFIPAIPLSTYLADEQRFFSHSTSKEVFWNRKLDYLFASPGLFVANSGLVHQDQENGGMATMPLSDHAPLSVIVRLP